MVSTTWPAIITLLNIMLLLWTGALVVRARTKYAISAPATTGDPDFERTFRVQMNTLENSTVFLPAVWLAALYGATMLVAVAGLVWIGARVAYAMAYAKDPAKRAPSFGISLLALAVLVGYAAFGVARALFAS